MIERLLAPIRRRIDNMVARAIVRMINDATATQEAQITLMADEVRDRCERFQQYGYTAVPLPGAQAVVVFVGGNRDHPLITNVDDKRHRPTDLAAGEVQVYDHLGKFIYLKEDGTLHIKAPKIHIEAEENLRLYAGTSYRWDVHGYADELRWTGGTTWQPETWKTGATVNANIANAINPPQVPF